MSVTVTKWRVLNEGFCGSMQRSYIKVSINIWSILFGKRACHFGQKMAKGHHNISLPLRLVLICSLCAARSKTTLSTFFLTVQRKTRLQPLWHFFLKQWNWWSSALHLFTLKKENSTHHMQIISCPFVYFRWVVAFPNLILPQQAFIQISSLVHHD